MATRKAPPPRQDEVRPERSQYEGGIVGQKGPATGQVLAVVALLPIGGVLLGLAGISLVGSMIGLAVAAPLFLLFSPVLVPAAIMIGIAVTGVLTSGAFGLTGLSSISWIINYMKQLPKRMDYARKRKMLTSLSQFCL